MRPKFMCNKLWWAIAMYGNLQAHWERSFGVEIYVTIAKYCSNNGTSEVKLPLRPKKIQLWVFVSIVGIGIYPLKISACDQGTFPIGLEFEAKFDGLILKSWSVVTGHVPNHCHS